MSGDHSIWERSTWDRAMGQGRLRPEHDRALSARRRQPAWPLAKEHGQQDLASDRTLRHLPDQGMGRAGEHLRARNQVRSVTHHANSHHGAASHAATGQDRVRKVQAALNQQGFNVGNADGKFGKRTKQALIAFQKQHGFRTTGKADRTTVQALLATGAAPAGGQGSNRGSDQGSNQPNANPASAVEAVPQGGAPATTGEGGAAPEPAASPQPTEGQETPPAPDLQMPDSGASGRVPAGSPQEDYKDDAAPGGGDQR